MKLSDIITSPWAILPNTLDEIHNIYVTHLRGEKIDIDGVEARLGRSLNNETDEMIVVDGVALITVEGAIVKRANMFTRVSGGVSTEILAGQIEQAISDDSVRSILLDIDSPGGTVDGTFELADRIYEMRGAKPIVALANGLMASAAYAIGAATDAIYMTGDTTHVGSIGVVSTHTDRSAYDKDKGLVTTEIYAGKYKRLVSQHKPLSTEGLESIQESVDYLYSVFVDRVSKFRGVAVSTVLDDMADGRLFIGQQALDAGLVDGVSTIDALVATLSEGRLPGKSITVAVSGDDSLELAVENTLIPMLEESINGHNELLNNPGDDEMSEKIEITKGYIAENHSDIAEAFRSDGANEARSEGATAERQRIIDVMAQSLPGHEALIETLAFDGVTTGPEAAVKVLNAERSVSKSTFEAQVDDAPIALEEEADNDVVNENDVPVEDRLRVKWDKSASLRQEFGGSFETYLAYAKANENGTIKVLGANKVA